MLALIVRFYGPEYLHAEIWHVPPKVSMALNHVIPHSVYLIKKVHVIIDLATSVLLKAVKEKNSADWLLPVCRVALSDASCLRN